MQYLNRLVARGARLATVSLALSVLCAPAARPAAAADSAYARTQYPIVLIHGLMGFSDIAGLDYFYRVAGDLRAQGATVLVASLSAVNDNDVRGEQLLQQLLQWQAAYGYSKFNLVGHSQGGTTARYVAGVAPALVASVTSISSPHDLSGPGGQGGPLQWLTQSQVLANFLGAALGWLSGHPDLPQDAAALTAWATNTTAFNDRFPAGRPTTYCGQGAEQVNGIYYYSVAGNKPKTNVFDPSDLVMQVDPAVPGDGLVSVCAAHWGKVLRDDYPWNHLDEMNHLFGLTDWRAPSPLAFYRAQANRLKLLGL